MDVRRLSLGRAGMRLAPVVVAVLSVGLGGCSSGDGEEEPIVIEGDTGSTGPDTDAGGDTAGGTDTAAQGCKDDYPVSQGPTEPCCPEGAAEACY